MGEAVCKAPWQPRLQQRCWKFFKMCRTSCPAHVKNLSDILIFCRTLKYNHKKRLRSFAIHYVRQPSKICQTLPKFAGQCQDDRRFSTSLLQSELAKTAEGRSLKTSQGKVNKKNDLKMLHDGISVIILQVHSV